MAIAPKKEQAAVPAQTQKQDLKEPVGLNPQQSLKKLILGMKEQLAAALPKHLDADRIARIAMTAVSVTPKLAECTQESFLGALLTSAQLGLEPNTKLGEAWLIPYERNIKLPNGEWKSILEVQFQIGYKGLVSLCERAKIYSFFSMNYVLPTDEFRVTHGFNRNLEHERKKNPDGSYVDTGTAHTFYAIYKTKDGGGDFRDWSREKVQQHAQKYSKSFDAKKNEFRKGSAWAEHFDAMAMKTVMIDLLKIAPKSVELQKAVAAENAVIRVDPAKPAIPGELPVNISFDHFEQLEPGPSETMAALAAAEIDAKEKVRQDLLAKAKERIDARIAAGADMVSIQDKIGMSVDDLKDLDSQQLMAVIEAVGKP
jgi:recombination protein RecT